MNKEEFINIIKSKCTPLPGSMPESINYTLTVKKKYEGLSIIDFYCQTVPRSTKEIWLHKIEKGNLKLNGKTISTSYLVRAGDLTSHVSEPKVEPNVSLELELIYECDDFWVINKPSPLPMHASGRFVRNTLINILEKSFPNEEFKMVHRIDANTTGIVILAKNKSVANKLREQFEQKEIKKQYIALVEGIVEKDRLFLSGSIGKETIIGGARMLNKEGKHANTTVEVLERRQNRTLLKLTPITGRTNQLRLHLSEASHPIVGDLGYKDISYFKNNPFTYPSDTLFLHAHKLTFIHPTTNQKTTFEAPIPKKFTDV